MKYILGLIMFFSCGSNSMHRTANVTADSLDKEGRIVIGQSGSRKSDKLPIDELTMGVISLKEDAKGEITFYDEHSNIWRTFPLDDKLAGKINPYSINLDYQNLVIRVVDQKSDFYKVIINESSGETKYIKKNDRCFNFETWDKHILKAFSVEFNLNENPIRENPDKNAAILKYDKDEFYHPVEVRNDWLKVKWGDNDNEKYGWIIWKKGKKLLVSIFYVA